LHIRYIQNAGECPIEAKKSLNGIQEVSGSIPLISTIKALKTLRFQGFFLVVTIG